MEPRFIVLGDLKMWLFHASSFPQSKFPYEPGGFQTAPLPLLAALELTLVLYRKRALTTRVERNRGLGRAFDKATSKTTVTIRNMETAEPKGQSRASSSPTVLHSSVREPGGKTSGTKK